MDRTESDEIRALRESVRTLLARHVDVNMLAADGSTALHWAAQRNDLALVDQLLRAGASAKASTRYNVPPLYFAALNGNARMIERLVAAGADANATAYEGQTMLMTAALSGRPDAVRLLLQRGARVDATEPYRGQTALMWAASEGNTDAAAVLLEAGANVSAKSTAGFTPLATSFCASASWASMTSLNFSNGCAPLTVTPLMRNAGVPVAPIFFDIARSSSNLAAYFFEARASLNFAAWTPAAVAHFS